MSCLHTKALGRKQCLEESLREEQSLQSEVADCTLGKVKAQQLRACCAQRQSHVQGQNLSPWHAELCLRLEKALKVGQADHRTSLPWRHLGLTTLQLPNSRQQRPTEGPWSRAMHTDLGSAMGLATLQETMPGPHPPCAVYNAGDVSIDSWRALVLL